MKTSINLSEEDKDFAEKKGNGNVSNGIRYCIEYTRDKEVLLNQIREIIGFRGEEKSVSENQNVKNHILGLLEDD